MKLAAKFNLVLLIIFSVGAVITGLLVNTILQDNARQEVVDRASLMMQAALAMRTYTIKEIKPLLVPHMQVNFLPQTVPAYAATQAFEYLRASQPEYTYKEATLNPTNPRNRPTDWETDLINEFRNHDTQTELFGTRETPTGPSLYLARPIRVSNPACLTCHSTPEVAPASLRKLYGDASGFGWQLDEVVGAQIVSVPTAVAGRKARDTLFVVMGLLIGGFVLTALVLNFMLRRIVVKPAMIMAAIADDVSKGKLDAAELSVKGTDEMSVLAVSFSRMRRSLEKAMQLLE